MTSDRSQWPNHQTTESTRVPPLEGAQADKDARALLCKSVKSQRLGFVTLGHVHWTCHKVRHWLRNKSWWKNPLYMWKLVLLQTYVNKQLSHNKYFSSPVCRSKKKSEKWYSEIAPLFRGSALILQPTSTYLNPLQLPNSWYAPHPTWNFKNLIVRFFFYSPHRPHRHLPSGYNNLASVCLSYPLPHQHIHTCPLFLLLPASFISNRFSSRIPPFSLPPGTLVLPSECLLNKQQPRLCCLATSQEMALITCFLDWRSGEWSSRHPGWGWVNGLFLYPVIRPSSLSALYLRRLRWRHCLKRRSSLAGSSGNLG